MPDVALVRCDEYGRELVARKVREAVDLLGGIGSFVKPGQTVCVKPNILRASPPEDAICTHPDVMWGVCSLLRDHGCRVVLAESMGAGTIYGPSQLRKAYEVTGYDPLRQLGVELNEDPGYREVPNPNGKLIKRFQIIDPVMEADAVVVVSKLKTHLLTNMTAATKNLFGTVPGMEKASFHGRLEDPLDFSRMLVDLNELVKPRLQIIDAIIAMEGDGPNSGDPRKVGAILASPSYAAADVAAARLIGFDPRTVPTIEAAMERGILDHDLGINVKGASIEELMVPDFRPPSTYVGGKRRADGVFLRKVSKMMRAYALRPRIDRDRCTGCERCVRACPTQTIILRHGRAMVKHRDCIACYTCHEMCNNEAIELERTLTGRLMASLMERKAQKRKE